ncbi:MAG: hypothetical protein LBL46_01465, partial [Rickettsiales bacterium]|nr:hypothetical protein [Rickettsiales bacterium]
MKNQISNEQCAMGNRSARQRNSKLLLLIASCSLLITGEAGAAKLCNKIAPTWEMIPGSVGQGVAVGEGCR